MVIGGRIASHCILQADSQKDNPNQSAMQVVENWKQRRVKGIVIGMVRYK